MLSILLLLLYSFSSTGTSLNLHYCMGEYAGASLFKKSDLPCSKCGMKERGGCCRDEEKLVKPNHSDHSLIQIAVLFPNLIAVLVPPIYFISEAQWANSFKYFSVKPNPPPLIANSLYLLNRVFRI